MRNQTQTQWKIWKTIEIGVHQDNRSLLLALRTANITINKWVDDIMKKEAFKLSQEKGSINLVLVSLSDLGLKPNAMLTLGEIYFTAQSLGLRLCASEVGPLLCLAYQTQPGTRSIVVAMEPIKDSGGLDLIFGLWKDVGKTRLSYTIGDAQTKFESEDHLVFTI